MSDARDPSLAAGSTTTPPPNPTTVAVVVPAVEGDHPLCAAAKPTGSPGPSSHTTLGDARLPLSTSSSALADAAEAYRARSNPTAAVAAAPALSPASTSRDSLLPFPASTRPGRGSPTSAPARHSPRPRGGEGGCGARAYRAGGGHSQTGGHAPGKGPRTVLVDGFEYSDDDEGNVMGNGCGEAVSRNSSEEDEDDVGPATRAMHLREPVARTRRGAPPAMAAAASAVPTMPASAVKAAAAAEVTMGLLRGHPTRSGSSSSGGGGGGGVDGHGWGGGRIGLAGGAPVADDASTVVSGLQLMMQGYEEEQCASACASSSPAGGPSAPVTKSFLDRFAPLYEIAIFEIILECERRVASASPADRDRQYEQLKGRSNASLAVSAHAFNSPVTPMQRTFSALRMPSTQQQHYHHAHPHNNLRVSSGKFGESAGVSPTGPTTCSLPTAPGAPCHQRVPSLSFSCSYASSAAGMPPVPQPSHGLMPTAGDGSQGYAPPPAIPSHAHARVVSMAAPSYPTMNGGPCTTRGGAVGTADVSGESRSLECLPPAESIERLLRSLDAQMRFQESAPLVFMAALAYLARFAGDCVSSYGSVTPANWFRMTVIAILTASKMYNDKSTRKLNRVFADASGIPLREVGKLELDFLYLLDFRLLLEEADVEEWVLWMERLAARHGMVTLLQSFMAGPTLTPPDTADAASSLSRASRPTSDAAASRSRGGLPTFAAAADAGGGARAGVRGLPLRSDAPTAASAAGERLFSVVHAAAEPTTPPTVRELSRLGAAPPSPLPPPAQPPASPLSFFKRDSAAGGGASSLAGRATTAGSAASRPGRGREVHAGACSRAGGAVAFPALPRVAERERVATAAHPIHSGSGSGSGGRGGGGGGGGVLQRVREALNVTASLVRGQLNVMRSEVGATAAPTGPLPPPPPARSPSTSRAAMASVIAPTRAEASFYPTSTTATVAGGVGAGWGPDHPSRAGVGAAARSRDYAGDEDDDDDDDDEDGVGAEGEEGYWDDYGYYHYFDDEEGYYDEEGNYFLYADDEEGDGEGLGGDAADPSGLDGDAAEAVSDVDEDTFARPPPRTHSPPAL